MEQTPISELSFLESNPAPKATPRLEGGARDAALEGNNQFVHFILHAWGLEISLTLSTLKTHFPIYA